MTVRLLKNRIISFEQAELASGPDGSPSPLRLVEVLAYFGSAGLFIGTLALMVEVALTDDLLFGGIDNIPGGFVVLVGAVLLGALGYRLTGSQEGAAKRSGGFTLGAGFALFAVAVNLLLLELDAGDFTPVLVAAPIVAAAYWVYRRHESVPTQLAIFVAAVEALTALLVVIQVVDYTNPQDAVIRLAVSGGLPEAPWLALVFMCGLGVAWVWFTNEGWFMPRNTGFAVGSLYAALQGLELFGSDDGWVILFAVITGFFVYGGLVWRSSVLLGIGAVHLVLFVWMVFSILVDDVTPVSVALWFGVPGLSAILYSLYSLTQQERQPAE